MAGESETYTCARCGTEFGMRTPHTEVVRRDFVDVPRPSRIDRLCVDCWQAYVEEFLGRDVEDVRDAYDSVDTGP